MQCTMCTCSSIPELHHAFMLQAEGLWRAGDMFEGLSMHAADGAPGHVTGNVTGSAWRYVLHIEQLICASCSPAAEPSLRLLMAAQ